jgi:hypothetical protein
MFKITKLQDDYIDRRITSEDFHSMKKAKKPLIGLELKLKNLKQSTSPFKTFINKKVQMLENIVMYTSKRMERPKRRF